MWRGPAWEKVRDTVWLGLSGGAFTRQAFFVENPQLPLLVLYAVMMAGPGVLATWWLAQSGIASGSAQPPLPPAPPASPSSPSST